MKNQHSAGSQIVLFKIGDDRPNQPGLGVTTLQIQSHVVLYKKLRPALRIPRSLKLAVVLNRIGMRLPVNTLITGMSFAPLPTAIADDLGIFRIDGDLAPMIFGAPAALALRAAADDLIRTELRGLE